MKLSKKDMYSIQENVGDGIKKALVGHEEKQLNVSVRVSEQRIKLPQNIMVFQEFATLAAMNLKPSTNRVLMFLFGLSAYENFISIDVKTISEELRIGRGSVISALKELQKNNIVVKLQHPRDKRRHDYVINPSAAWKGNSYSRQKQMKLLEKNTNQTELWSENNK